MRDIIINYVPTIKIDYQILNNTYELTTSNKIINLLIKFALKRKWLKPYTQIITIQKTKQFNFDKISDAIKELNDQLFFYTGKNPVSVMIGRKQANLLEGECFDQFRFNMPLHLRYGDGREKFMHLDIIVNPFIDGVVLLNRDMLGL